jgi:gliding motility-associated-like protein
MKNKVISYFYRSKPTKMKKYILLIISLITIFTRLSAQTVSITPSQNEVCFDSDREFSFTSSLSGFGTSTLTWNFGDGTILTGVTNPSHTYDSVGIYRVRLTVTYLGSETKYDEKIVRVRPIPNAYFTYKDTFQRSDLTYIFRSKRSAVSDDTTMSHYSYMWTIYPTKGSTAGAITRSHSQANERVSIGGGDEIINDSIIYQYSDTGTYTVRLRVSDYFGCSETSQQNFRITNLFEVPNAFTPNGDGKNDFFYVQTNGRTVYSLKIFTRNGVMIYKNTSPTIMWDGATANGDMVAPGTYFYVIDPVEVQPEDTADKANKKAGFVMLIRNKDDMK